MKKIVSIIMLATVASFAADIVGQGFLKTNGGEVKTCAGNEVYLEKIIKKTFEVGDSYDEMDYGYLLSLLELQKELINSIIQLGGAYPDELSEEKKLISLVNSYNADNVDTSSCDAQGNFEFFDLKPGLYRTTTNVTWYVGSKKQGGYINKVFTMKKKKKKILITK